MVATDREIESFKLGRVVVRAFDAIEAQAGLLLGLALLLLAIPLFGINLWQLPALITAAERDRVEAVPIVIAGVAARVVFGGIAQAVFAHAMMRRVAGAKIGFAASLAAVPRLGPQVLMIWILVTAVVGLVSAFSGALTAFFVRPSLGTLSSFMFMIPAMPGIWFWTLWSVAIPAFIDEPRGIFPSLGRSVALTRIARGKIFAGGMVLVFLEMVLNYFLYHLLETPRVWALVASTGATVLAVLSAALTVSIYLELRRISDDGELERVFA